MADHCTFAAKRVIYEQSLIACYLILLIKTVIRFKYCGTIHMSLFQASTTNNKMFNYN